jgi:hypothetical protein
MRVYTPYVHQLCIGIAGKMVKGMTLGDGDWSGVLEVLEEEFDQKQSMEESVIATSLRGIRGPHRAHILGLFRALALVRRRDSITIYAHGHEAQQ